MFGNVVRGVPGERFEEEIARDQARARRRRSTPSSTPTALRELTRRFQALYELPAPIRASSSTQAIRAVFDSWMGERAVAYRRINGIPDDWGTAVNVQQMVFGNKGADVGLRRGVLAATRSPARPSRAATSCVDAQGEDVVSGVRTPRDLPELARLDARRPTPSCWRSCARSSATTATCRTPSSRSRRGGCTCCRRAAPSGPAQAAVRFAVDAVDEGLLTPAEAIATIDAGSLDALLHPTFDPDARLRGRRARRRRLAGRGQGRDRLHRRRRPWPPPRTGAT